jgi:O-antigen ligase
LFFFVCAFALTLRQCRTLILGNIACTSAILLSAVLFGGSVGDRFAIPSSFLFGGANDLALALVSSLGFTVFLIMQKSILAQILGAGEFLLTLYLMLKTGSRGGFIALAVFLMIVFIFSASRWKLVVLMIPALAVVPMLPGSTLNRLVEIAAPTALNDENASGEAAESQMERTMLLRKSVVFAVTHPLFGVGPGEFTDALYESDEANKTHTHALGTHNTYTQVASECGFPALAFYLVVLFSSIASNFRIMKRTRNMPGGQQVFTMALCLLGSLVAFGVNTIFHHDAYSGTLPILSGMSAALAMASRNGDPAWIEAETAAGNA